MQLKFGIGAFVLVCLTYIVIYSVFFNPNEFAELQSGEIQSFFKISEDNRMAITGAPQDSLQLVKELSPNERSFLQDLPKEKYQILQNSLDTNLSMAKWVYSIIRLILIAYILAVIYWMFTKPLNYEISFQKAMYTGTKISVLFALYTAVATLLVQFIFNQIPNSVIVFQALLMQFLNMLKTGLIYTVAISVFIYFHPHNTLRKKSKKQAE